MLPRRSCCCCRFVCALGVLLASLATGGLEARLSLPVWPERLLNGHRYIPSPARSFLAAYGDRVEVYWDDLLETPRYVSARGALSIFAPGRKTATPLSSESIAVEVLRFVDEHAEFLGVESGELNEPLVEPSGGGWQVAVRQVVEGVFVRGANLRLSLASDGSIESLSAFLLRHGPKVPPSFVPLEAAQAELAAERPEYLLLDAEPELAFSGDLPSDTGGLWRLRAERPDGALAELLIGAGSGRLLEERVFENHLDFVPGSVKAVCPTLDRSHPAYYFTIPANPDPAPQPLGDLVVESLTGNGQSLYTLVGADGVFEAPVDYTLVGVELKAQVGWLFALTDCIQGGDPLGAPCTAIERSQAPMAMLQSFGPNCAREGDFFRSQRSAFAPGERLDFLYGSAELLGPEVRKQRSYFALTWHHLATFFHDHRDRMAEFDIFEDKVPLEVGTLSNSGQELYYHPQATRGRICLRTDLLVTNAAGETVEQPLSPSFLHHEYAHHAVFQMTRAMTDRKVDCNHRLAQEDLQGDEDPAQAAFEAEFFKNCLRGEPTLERERAEQILEGVVDAMAAVQMHQPVFGRYLDGGSFVDGPMMYNLSRANNPPISRARERVARSFWNLWHDMGLLGAARVEGEKIAAQILYEWTRRQRVQNGTDLTLFFDGALFRSISDAAEAVFDKTPFRQGSREAFEGTLYNVLDDIRRTYGSTFIRGDANLTNQVDLADAISILLHAFAGPVGLKCLDAFDADDNGKIDLHDGIRVLRFSYAGGDPPPAPFPDCGVDATNEDRLNCLRFDLCNPQ